MLGAMQYAQQKLNLTFSAGAGAAIMEAIKQHNDGLFQSIEAFNDTQKSFRSVRRVLEAAKTVTPSDYSTAVMKAKETFDGPNNAAYVEIVISAYREARAKQRAERSKAVKAVAVKLAAELAGSMKMQADRAHAGKGAKSSNDSIRQKRARVAAPKPKLNPGTRPTQSARGTATVALRLRPVSSAAVR